MCPPVRRADTQVGPYKRCDVKIKPHHDRSRGAGSISWSAFLIQPIDKPVVIEFFNHAYVGEIFQLGVADFRILLAKFEKSFFDSRISARMTLAPAV
jgi:hypothetical protein